MGCPLLFADRLCVDVRCCSDVGMPQQLMLHFQIYPELPKRA